MFCGRADGAETRRLSVRPMPMFPGSDPLFLEEFRLGVVYSPSPDAEKSGCNKTGTHESVGSGVS